MCAQLQAIPMAASVKQHGPHPMRRRPVSGIYRVLVVLLLAYALPAGAQNYPARVVRLVIPYGPGGASDLLPRLVAERMTVDLGQPMVVENKPGALGIIAINDALGQAADGYTVMAADAGLWAIAPAMQSVTYDFLRDFLPVSLLYTSSIVMYTSTGSGIASLADLITQAKARPGQINFAIPGIGSVHHLALETFNHGLGVNIKNVPYRSGAEALPAVLRGDVQIGFSAISALVPLEKAGKVRFLAAGVATRLKQLPEVPTVAEVTGLKDFHFPGQSALVVKTGTPRAIVDKLSASANKAALQPDVVAKASDFGVEMTPGTPQKLSELIGKDIVKYGNAIKISGAKVQ